MMSLRRVVIWWMNGMMLGGHDGNCDVGDVTYDWYNTDYDDPARCGKRVG